MKIAKTLSIIMFTIFCATAVNAQKHNTKNNIDTLVNAYMGIKDALIANDGTQAHYKANELFNILKSQPDKGLSKDQRQILIDHLEKLLYDSRHINETIAVDHQREHFASLSKNMYEVLKGIKMNTVLIYEQYCPMKKAYWLSESKQIKNPYFGSKMLTCGKVTETLASVK